MTQAQQPQRIQNLEECRVMNLETIGRLNALNDWQAKRIAELEAELIKEAARTADYKLRAEQFEQRLDMANKLGNEARAELAALKAAPAAQQGLDALLKQIEEVKSDPRPSISNISRKTPAGSLLHAMSNQSSHGAPAMTAQESRPWWRDRADAIERQVACGQVSAMQCFAKMQELLNAQPVARAPLTPYTLREIIKKLNANHDEDGWNFGDLVHEVEIYHGITQEKQRPRQWSCRSHEA